MEKTQSINGWAIGLILSLVMLFGLALYQAWIENKSLEDLGIIVAFVLIHGLVRRHLKNRDFFTSASGRRSVLSGGQKNNPGSVSGALSDFIFSTASLFFGSTRCDRLDCIQPGVFYGVFDFASVDALVVPEKTAT